MSEVENSADATSARRKIRSLGVTYHIYRPLESMGYVYVDQIADIPIEELSKILQKRSLRSLLEKIDRGDEYVEKFGPDYVEVDGEKYPIGPLRNVSTLVGTARHFGFRSTDELQNALDNRERVDERTGKIVPFGWEDIARYRNGSRPSSTAPVLMTEGEDDGEITEKLEEYARDFDQREWTSSDHEALWSLAAMEIRLKRLQRIQISAEAISDPSNAQRTDEILRLSQGIQRLKDELGISLRKRAEANARVDSASAITDLATRGKRLLAERATILQHCGVLLAICLLNFPRHVKTTAVTVECPVCGEVIEWKIVTEGILSLYAEAGSFVPMDAPPGMFDR